MQSKFFFNLVTVKIGATDIPVNGFSNTLFRESCQLRFEIDSPGRLQVFRCYRSTILRDLSSAMEMVKFSRQTIN